MSYQLIRGNALSLPLADESVDLIVTSPPYFALRSYTDGGEHYEGQIGSEATPQAFLEALWAVTAECVRVLKPSGSLWVNLGDSYSRGSRTTVDGTTDKRRQGDSRVPPCTFVPAKSLMLLPQRYAIGCIDQLGLICRAEVIWSKPNGLPESVTDRVRRSHEQWWHITKEPRYFSAVDEVREPHDDTFHAGRRGHGEVSWQSGPKGDVHGQNRTDGWGVKLYNPLGKLPGSVWTIPTEPLRVPDHLGVDHFAAFPSEFPRRIILGWSPSGVCVACGEGRRPVVTKELAVQDRGAIGSRGSRFNGTEDEHRRMGKEVEYGSTAATITGYTCACSNDLGGGGQIGHAYRPGPPTETGKAHRPLPPTRPAVVLDPFCGTGTVPAVAHILGRHGIGVDLSADYLRLAEWRCNDPGLRAKVLRVEKPKAVPDGQLDMFGNDAA